MGLHEFLSDALNEGRPGSAEFARLSAALHESGRHSHGHGRGRPGSESDRGEVRGRRGGHGGPGGFGGRGRGGHGRPESAGPEQVSAADVSGWLSGRLPDGWLTGPPQVTVDRDEIIIVGPLAAPEVAKTAGEDADGDAAAAAVAAAETGRISRSREDTREERIRIAVEAEHRYGRKIAWGATAGGTTELFTTMSVPVMTRLRQPERTILDTLVDAGVARAQRRARVVCAFGGRARG